MLASEKENIKILRKYILKCEISTLKFSFQYIENENVCLLQNSCIAEHKQIWWIYILAFWGLNSLDTLPHLTTLSE